jgi:Core-2/I-Branching enzyme
MAAPSAVCAGVSMPEPVIAYVVLCHHKPRQALRLAETIRRLSPRARVLLRHNQPSGYIDERQARGAGAELLVSDLTTRWGDWSLVEAAFEGFRHARALYDPAWTVLISGQDYPVRSLDDWERELLRGDDDAVVSGDALVTGPSKLRINGPHDELTLRYTHRWHRLPQLGVVPRLPRRMVRLIKAGWYAYLYPLQAAVTLNELPRGNGWMLGVRRRRVPWSPRVIAYKGEQWAALSRRAMEVALDGPEAAAWQRYYAATLVPDESYFPTVLVNSRVRIRRQSISWMRWHDEVTKPHPVTIDDETLPAAMASGAPFARKFDEDECPGVLDQVDRQLLHPAPVA